MSLDLKEETYRTIAPVGDPSLAGHPAYFLILLAILSIVFEAMLTTIPSLHQSYRAIFKVISFGAFSLLTIEYAVRLWVSPVRSNKRPAAAIVGYAVSFLGVVDLFVVLPYWLSFLFPVPDWCVMMAAFLSLLKLARFVPGLGIFISVFRTEGHSLLAALIVLIVLLIFAAGTIYVLENPGQPEIFASVPHTLWWAIVTIASVGYGDMVPLTPAARILAGFLMLLGIAVFAVPAGILATGFAKELRRRDFLVTWKTVSRMPLFAGLDANAIADITRLLTSEIIPPDTVIVRKGDMAQAMFFILEGNVEVEISPKPIRLTAGQYFGEIALLKDGERTATVISITEVHLLVLGVKDFRRLIDENPQIKTAVTRVAESRLAASS
jgi:voltage-gated potassium channel